MAGKSLLLTLILCVSAIGARAATKDEIVPAGTLLHCTMDEPNFSSKTAQAGDPVLCHLGPISSFGHSLFPRGAMLSGHLQDSKDPGHFVGKGWLQLEFDRIILPGAEVLPLAAKIVATPHLKTDREGKIRGGGHPRRDVVEWMIPVLWPIKIINLPRRGPYPARDAAGACGGSVTSLGAAHQLHSFAIRLAAAGVVDDAGNEQHRPSTATGHFGFQITGLRGADGAGAG
jgi:hypothetical protein